MGLFIHASWFQLKHVCKQVPTIRGEFWDSYESILLLKKYLLLWILFYDHWQSCFLCQCKCMLLIAIWSFVAFHQFKDYALRLWKFFSLILGSENFSNIIFLPRNIMAIWCCCLSYSLQCYRNVTGKHIYGAAVMGSWVQSLSLMNAPISVMSL